MRVVLLRPFVERRRGSAILSTLAVLFLLSVACALVAVTARATAARARAQSTADAVALAAAVDGDVAARVAAADRATIESVTRDEPDVVTVVIVRGGVRAIARAAVTCRGSCAPVP